MRKLKQVSLAVAIVLALSTGAMAGIIECPPGAPPPPQPPSITASGIIDTPPSDVTAPVASTDPVLDIALALLQSALSLF